MTPEKDSISYQVPEQVPERPHWWRVGNSPACFWWARTLYHYHWTPANDRSSRNPECDFLSE